MGFARRVSLNDLCRSYFVGRFPAGGLVGRGVSAAASAKNGAGGCILKKNAYLCSAYEHRIELWCNGNTSDFGSGILGSNPGSSTKKRQVSVSEPAFCFRLRIERAGCYPAFVWLSDSTPETSAARSCPLGGGRVVEFDAVRHRRAAASRRRRPAALSSACAPQAASRAIILNFEC